MADNEDFALPRWHNPADMQYGTQTSYSSNSLSRSTSLRESSQAQQGYPSPPSPAHPSNHLDPYAGYQQPNVNSGGYYPRYPHQRTQSTGLLSPLTPSYTASQPTSPVYTPMQVDRRTEQGLRRVRYASELRPNMQVPHYVGRPAQDQQGSWLGPLALLTTHLVQTYSRCNPAFHYESTHNPRRVLTKPSKPMHNEGYDNEDYDYILYVNDWLGVEGSHKYLILDILGQGTFGQVVKCQNMKTHEIVAVKVVKNKPAYFNQSMMEVTILELLNKTADPDDTHHILRLRDSFIHRNHLCLVFELLSSNLYELIKQNQFQGLSTQLVKVFMAQLLDALTVLKEQRLIHCDLKPENILLKSLQSPQIKVIDFGSACHEKQTVYTYIQSRFYRSPEVLLGMSYNAGIDMWSLGCIAVELFLGLPLFPGTSEYNQLTRIVEMLGLPPNSMLNQGKQTHQFFDQIEVYNPHMNTNEKKYRLKPIDQYSREHGTNEQPGKQYFKARNLPDIINQAPMPPSSSKSKSGNEVDREMNNRASFIDFCKGLLDLNPVTRWTPQQARQHPFITGDKFVKPYVPGSAQPSPQPPSSSPASHHTQTPAQDSKRPYGGLVPSQPKGQRAYQDAASYQQHLAQHQVYTAQQQQSQQAPYGARNPYMTGNTPTGSGGTSGSRSQPQTPMSNTNTSVPPPFPQPLDPSSAAAYAPPPPTAPATVGRLQHQSSHGQLGAAYTTSQGHPASLAPHLNPPSISVSSGGTQSGGYSGAGGYPPVSQQQQQQQQQQSSSSSNNNNRGRANTIGNNGPPPMDIPPALARLQQMNADVIQGGRNALTPVLNRDDAMREWERRQTGLRGAGGSTLSVYTNPELEYLARQAELVNHGGGMNWSQLSLAPGMGGGSGGLPKPVRYPHQQQGSKLAYATTGDSGDVPMGGDVGAGRRDQVMSNVRAAAAASTSSGGGTGGYRPPPTSSATAPVPPMPSSAPTLNLASPPQAYNTSGPSQRGGGGGYAPPTAAQQYAQSVMHSQGQTQFVDSPTSTGGHPLHHALVGGGDVGVGSYMPMQPDHAYQPQPPGAFTAGPPPQPNSAPASQQQQQRRQSGMQSGMEWGR